MRFRSVVLPSAVALAAVVAVPSSASAAVQCGLILPTKVVVNSPVERRVDYLTRGCWDNQADHANWRYDHASGTSFDINFSSEDLTGSTGRDFGFEWHDDDPMGRYALTPTGAAQADGNPLTQNSTVTYVKYHSELATTVTRTGTGISWLATATQWSGRSHAYVARPRVRVGLFHQASSTAPWKYAKATYTSSTGRARLSMATTKAGNYRLVIAETPTVWASYSRTIKGRI